MSKGEKAQLLADLPAGSQLAVGGAGFLNGVMEPLAGAYGPVLRLGLGVSAAFFLGGWLGWTVGMLVMSLVAGRLVERFGAKRVTIVSGVVYFGAYALIGFAPNLTVLTVILLFVGGGNAPFDVGWQTISTYINDHVDQRGGRAIQILNGLFSFGSVIGAALGLLAVWRHGAAGPVLMAVGLSGIALLLVAARRMPNPDVSVSRDRKTDRVRTPARVHLAALAGGCAVLPVGVGYIGGPLAMSSIGASNTLAVTALLGFTIAETASRLGTGMIKRGSRLADPVLQARVGAVTALIGLLLVIFPQTIPAMIAGFALLAAGMAPIAPLAQEAASRLWPDRRAQAAAVMTRYIYVTLPLGPAIAGPLAGLLGSLQDALATMLLLPIVLLLLARFLRSEPLANEL